MESHCVFLDDIIKQREAKIDIDTIINIFKHLKGSLVKKSDPRILKRGVVRVSHASFALNSSCYSKKRLYIMKLASLIIQIILPLLAIGAPAPIFKFFKSKAAHASTPSKGISPANKAIAIEAVSVLGFGAVAAGIGGIIAHEKGKSAVAAVVPVSGASVASA